MVNSKSDAKKEAVVRSLTANEIWVCFYTMFGYQFWREEKGQEEEGRERK